MPGLKKGFTGSVEKCRAVGILSVIFKVFQKLLGHQIASNMDKFLSKYQCGFKKGYSAQRCLLAMLEKCKRAVDQEKAFGALITA